MQEVHKKLGKLVAELRKKNGFSQEGFAMSADSTEATWEPWSAERRTSR
jgi:DNA-binding transcriptional regulator YiaG